MTNLLLLLIGGGIGTLSRHATSSLVYRVCGVGFPYGTFAVNMLGCFIIGFLVTLSQGRVAFEAAGNMLFIAGFCGAFTTFSTFIFETDNMLQDGEFAHVFLNIVLSVVVGLLLFRAGSWLGKIF